MMFEVGAKEVERKKQRVDNKSLKIPNTTKKDIKSLKQDFMIFLDSMAILGKRTK